MLATGYYSRQDTRTPVRIGVAALLLNIGFNVVIVLSLLQADYPAPHAGLAAATTLSALFNAGMLLRGLVSSGVYRATAGWGSFAARVLLATAAMGVAVYWLRLEVGEWTGLTLWNRCVGLGACVATGIGVYAAAAYAAGLRPESLGLRGKPPPATL